MNGPDFKTGLCVIHGHDDKEYKLEESVWVHITKEKSRHYYIKHFDKIESTLKQPDRILQSKKDVDCVYFEKRFDDFYIVDNAVLGRVFNYVVVNMYDLKVTTLYYSYKQKNQEQIWPATK